MRILLVCPEVPWPLDQGGRIRTFRLFVRGLADLGHEVDALLVRHNGQQEHREALAPYLRNVRYLSHPAGKAITVVRIIRSLATGVPFANLKYCPSDLRPAVTAMCAENAYDLVIAEHQHVADDVLAATRNAVVVDMQNVYSDLYGRVSKSSLLGIKAIHSRFQAPLASRQERRLSRALAILTVSPEDAASLTRVGAARQCFVVPNGVDVEYFRPGVAPPLGTNDCDVGTPLIVMTGSMDYFPNADGAIHLVKQVMPQVWSSLPRARVCIVGRDPGTQIRSLGADSRVTVTGGVPDVRPYLESATLAVVPLRSGSGTRLKALEAAAMSKAIVGTSIGLEGIPFSHGINALIVDSPQGMAESIVRLASDNDLARRIGAQARTLVEKDFSWDSCCRTMDDALSGLRSSPALSRHVSA